MRHEVVCAARRTGTHAPCPVPPCPMPRAESSLPHSPSSILGNVMLDDVKVLEPQLKQLLYGAVEHVQATKAALYLSASLDLNDKIYELVTAYGYNDPG